jgi:cytochrome oxidase Cu insertion factor (SCO1/SenC/PrrC family)
MKIGSVVLFFAGVSALLGGQETPSTNPTPPSSIGLEVGQRTPTFALSDQFGQKQSNETLKGSNGTVLLFFRSADW